MNELRKRKVVASGCPCRSVGPVGQTVPSGPRPKRAPSGPALLPLLSKNPLSELLEYTLVRANVRNHADGPEMGMLRPSHGQRYRQIADGITTTLMRLGQQLAPHGLRVNPKLYVRLPQPSSATGPSGTFSGNLQPLVNSRTVARPVTTGVAGRTVSELTTIASLAITSAVNVMFLLFNAPPLSSNDSATVPPADASEFGAFYQSLVDFVSCILEIIKETIDDMDAQVNRCKSSNPTPNAGCSSAREQYLGIRALIPGKIASIQRVIAAAGPALTNNSLKSDSALAVESGILRQLATELKSALSALEETMKALHKAFDEVLRSCSQRKNPTAHPFPGAGAAVRKTEI